MTPADIASEGSARRVKLLRTRTLSQESYALREYTLDYRRRDGSRVRWVRYTYDRGDRAVALLYSSSRNTVLLTRQFRLPVFLAEDVPALVEVPGGLLDGELPAVAVAREVQEETGVRIKQLTYAFSAYMDPRVSRERVHFFTAPVDAGEAYGRSPRVTADGDEIEVIEISFCEALSMVQQGLLVDAKTILLLYHARLKGLVGTP